ncbi:MAG: hypothetical protein ABI359_10915 [Ginsengibacter sp.]
MADKNISEKDEKRRMDDAKNDKNTLESFEEAEKDIAKDPDFNMSDEEDLDEGELARKEGHP